MVCCDPSEPQMEFNDPDELLIGLSLLLTFETMLPRTPSSACVATCPPENAQEDPRNISSVGSKTRHSAVLPEELSRKWQAGIDATRQALRATTRRGVSCATAHPLTCRCHTDHFSWRHPRLNTQFHSDAICDNQVTQGQQACPGVCSKGFHPMNSKQERTQALRVFAEETSASLPICAPMVRLS